MTDLFYREFCVIYKKLLKNQKHLTKKLATLKRYEQRKICWTESLSNRKASVISSAKNALFL
jgi:hypothetical protein